jgi:hypothetical protein
MPEQSDNIPSEYMVGMQFYDINMPGNVLPWTGYWARVDGMNITVANAFGVWFELQKDHDTWAAVRPARLGIHCNDWPMAGIDTIALKASGKPLPPI